jgi:hypothetical protein
MLTFYQRPRRFISYRDAALAQIRQNAVLVIFKEFKK